MSDCLWPHALQHARLFYQSPAPEACSNLCPWVSDTIQPSHPLSSLLLLPSVFPRFTVFSNEPVLLIRWPKMWQFSISLSNEYLGLISFRIDWFNLLFIQGTLKRLSQSSKTSILWHPAFFIVQLSHPYITAGKKPWLWLDRPLSAKPYLCFLICYLGLS